MTSRELVLVSIILFLLLNRRGASKEGFAPPSWMPNGSRYVLTMDEDNNLHTIEFGPFLDRVQREATQAAQTAINIDAWTTNADARIRSKCTEF